MRRAAAALSSSLLAVLLVGACSGGSAELPSLPTSVPPITLPTLPTRTETVTATTTNVETETQTQTQTRTETETRTATPAPTTAPATAPASSGTTWWPWLVLVVLLALAGLIWYLVVRHKRQQVIDAWDARLASARLDARWVEESLVPQVLSRPTAVEAGAVWSGAQPRVLAIDEELHALATDSPDQERSADAAGLRQRYDRLVNAVGADATAGSDPVASSPDAFRARRAAIDTARRDLRAAIGPVQSTSGSRR